MSAASPLPGEPIAATAASPLPSSPDSAADTGGYRQWNSETLRAAYLLAGKEMLRHPPRSRAYKLCFAAYQQLEVTDVGLGSIW